MTEAAPGKLTRQQIYDRIRESSKDEYILAEMKRLGFWPKDDEKPTPAEQAIKRQGELEKELRELSSRLRLAEDPEAALRQMRKERMLESRQRQEENRQRRNRDRYEKAIAWQERQGSEIDYVGHDVSAGLADQQSDTAKLASHGLPELHDAAGLADAMGISIRELRFLCYARRVSRISHYRQFEIRKKTGGTRRISAPMPRLKRAQYWLLEKLFAQLDTHDSAHGFVTGRSIVSNATPHVGSNVVVNLDLQNFFPTITYRRVKGLLRALGYSEQVATLIALLSTEADTDIAELHGETFYLAKGERRLPQGSPASPAISNLICRRLDRRLAGMATKLNFRYTRYADDMTFSAARKHDADNLNKLLWRARSIIRDEGFVEHPDKTRIMRQGAKQEVTGIVVNDKVSLDRQTLRRFRAALYRLEKDGVDDVRWNGAPNVVESMAGYANYVAMVDPARGVGLQKRMTRVRRKLKGGRSAPPSELNNRRLRAAAAAGKAARDDWWQPAEPAAPELEKTPEQIKAEKRERQRALRAERAPQRAAAAATRGERSRTRRPHIDTRTGRFRPTARRALTLILVFLGISLITGNADWLVAATSWVVVNQFLWRQPFVTRLALTIAVFMVLAGLLSRYLVGL